MQYSQLVASIGEQLLEEPDVHIAYLTPTWLLSLHQFLSCHTMTITVSDSFQIPLAGPKDEYVMQSAHLSCYSISQQRDINLVRMYLQVNTLAELSDPQRQKAIDLCYLDSKRPPTIASILNGPVNTLRQRHRSDSGKDASSRHIFVIYRTGTSGIPPHRTRYEKM